MISVDVLIVGGGPAGASCAWRLRRHGVECLVLDRAAFPRPKLCAGWITPQVIEDLAIKPGEYPGSFMSFGALRLKARGVGCSVRTIQHSIRRIEFDDWLLKRSCAPVIPHNVRAIRQDNDEYVVDELWRSRWIVGAAGTRCPVYRTFFREVAPRDQSLQVAVIEEEFAYGWSDPSCYLWFFDGGLPGYAWYVPKSGGHLNVGIGGLAQKLSGRRLSLKDHWRRLGDLLEKGGLVLTHRWNGSGYTYYLRGATDVARKGRAFLTGDAAGLSTVDLAEGIGPAVRSGIAVADAIVTDRSPDFKGIGRRSLPPMLRDHMTSSVSRLRHRIRR